jgi:two-component system, NtrC family, sensor histidine kinase HydH
MLGPREEAEMAPRPPGFDEIQRQEVSRLFGRMVGIRLAAIPVAVALVLALAVFEPSPWRAAFLVALLVPTAAFFIAEVVRFRRRGFHPRAILWNLVGMLVVQVALAFATGALESPVAYAFVPLAGIAGLFAGRALAPFVAAQVVAVWALAAAELSGAIPDLNLAFFGGGARGGHTTAHLLTTAVVLSVVLVLASRAGRAARVVFDRMLRQALHAQEDALRAHADRAEELTALSAEIAHELKNPLASVKGLAALLADGGGAPAKQAERLAVLRREVARMQGILDEFLNFSRPLVPLALRAVDLAALAREVAALHEGMAHERGVALEVTGAPAQARCDPRKVKQVLINLVQNALDASAAGGAVEIAVEAGEDGARVAVLDRGAGFDAALADRAFDPGVTTKARGSGLGLTIARALARQHGGDVVLAAREGGGCAATLTLPAFEAPRAAEAAR